MTHICTTATWRPKPGKDDEFVAAWTAFAGWAAGRPGAGTLRLMRDSVDPGRFMSFGVWEGNEAVRAWKSSPDFREHIGSVLQHVDVFEPREYGVVATASSAAAAPLAQVGEPR